MKIEIDILDNGHLDFLSTCIDGELSAEARLKNIAKFHLTAIET